MTSHSIHCDGDGSCDWVMSGSFARLLSFEMQNELREKKRMAFALCSNKYGNFKCVLHFCNGSPVLFYINHTDILQATAFSVVSSLFCMVIQKSKFTWCGDSFRAAPECPRQTMTQAPF